MPQHDARTPHPALRKKREKTGAPGGPSWVAAIVNAIGAAQNCDSGAGYWSDTVILITWDDWGGYYDDVVPPNCGVGQSCGYSNSTGQQYVYGFRVPLLGIGAYVRQVTPQGGYISGAGVGASPDCGPPNTYCHDFGSILNFIEYAFGSGLVPLGGVGGISPDYKLCRCSSHGQTTPSSQQLLSLRFLRFQSESASTSYDQWGKVPSLCFTGSLSINCFTSYPVDPDNDANETD